MLINVHFSEQQVHHVITNVSIGGDLLGQTAVLVIIFLVSIKITIQITLTYH